MRLRPDLTVDEAISYLRKQGVDASLPILYGYVLDAEQQLLGVVPTHKLFSSQTVQTVRDVMKTRPVAVTDDTDQEVVGQLFRDHGLFAVPVVDDAGPMKGVVTVDDIVHVIDEEATEDMQNRRRRSAEYAVPQGNVCGDAAQTGRLADAVVSRRDAHRHGDGVVRGATRHSNRACSILAVNHQ